MQKFEVLLPPGNTLFFLIFECDSTGKTDED